jgi:hypothetical protein
VISSRLLTIQGVLALAVHPGPVQESEIRLRQLRIMSENSAW